MGLTTRDVWPGPGAGAGARPEAGEEDVAGRRPRRGELRCADILAVSSPSHRDNRGLDTGTDYMNGG